MSEGANLDEVFLRKVWRRLRDSSVPIVDPQDYADAANVADRLNCDINSHLFLPSTIHGYLGIQKGGGVTRFLPILSARDLGVYYYLCYRLAPRILKKTKGVFGAWHMKPEVTDQEEEEATAFGQGYGVDPFSSHWWLKEWEQFNEMIRTVTSDPEVGRFVVTTDIANFYDSIEIPRLINGIRHVAHDDVDTVEALNAFLASWNRRHTGYMASTKGIPQEIISDASRVLSHFYLQEFDAKFKAYCLKNKLTYIRWADDMIVFGHSNQKLQSSVHFASGLLRDLGLNLNAAKTKYMTKSQLAQYRCLGFVQAISSNSVPLVAKELKKVKSWIVNKKEFRLDTVFRALIGFLSKNHDARTAQNIAFLQDVAENHVDLLHSLNNTQMLRYIQLMEKPLSEFDRLRRQICKADFGGPKASYLHMMRKYRNQMASIGVTREKALKAISEIETSSADSEVIMTFCVTKTREQYTGS